MAKNILWFEIAVKEPNVSMDIGKSGSHFVENGFDFGLGQPSMRLLSPGINLEQVGLNVVENQIELGIGKDNFLQLHNVGVLQFPQRFNLSQLEALINILILLLHFLDSNNLSFRAYSFENDPECAISQSSFYLILLHNNFYNSKRNMQTIFSILIHHSIHYSYLSSCTYFLILSSFFSLSYFALCIIKIYQLNMKKVQPQKTPSPRSTHARKPFLNITNLTHLNTYNSLDYKSKNQKELLSKHDSTASIKVSSSSQPKSETPVERIRSRKNSTTKGRKQENKKEEVYCRNHKKRQAKHMIEMRESSGYYCLECCFYYAKQGYKVNLILSEQTNKKEGKVEMMMEAKNYLRRCEEMKYEIKKWEKDCENVYEQLERERYEKVRGEKRKMEEQIRKIKYIYENEIQLTNKIYEQKMMNLREVEKEASQIKKIVTNTELDIETNMETMSLKVQEKQFRTIMDKYWKKINSVDHYLKENQPSFLLSSPLHLQSVQTETMKETKAEDEFTFSKKERLETPPSKMFEKIRLVNSEGETLNDSEFKDSVVDMKLSFQ